MSNSAVHSSFTKFHAKMPLHRRKIISLSPFIHPCHNAPAQTHFTVVSYASFCTAHDPRTIVPHGNFLQFTLHPRRANFLPTATLKPSNHTKNPTVARPYFTQSYPRFTPSRHSFQKGRKKEPKQTLYSSLPLSHTTLVAAQHISPILCRHRSASPTTALTHPWSGVSISSAEQSSRSTPFLQQQSSLPLTT